MRTFLTLAALFACTCILSAEEVAALPHHAELAREYAAKTGQTYEMCLQALKVGTWCRAHPQGGIANGKTYDAVATAELLLEATRVLNTQAKSVRELDSTWIYRGAQWPELRTRDGRVFLNVTFSKVGEDEISFVNVDGLTTLKVTELPVGTKYYASNVVREPAAPIPAQQPEVITEEENASRAWQWYQWAKANPSGDSEFNKAQRDALLAQSTQILAAWNTAHPKQTDYYSGSLSTRPARPVGRSMYDPQRIAEQQVRNRIAQGQPRAEVQRVIESSIYGEFRGFAYGRLFKLQNGQIWEQIDTEYDYQYDYSPDVLIYPSRGRMMMKVEDVDDPVEVQQVR